MDSQILDDGVDITFGGNSAIFTAEELQAKFELNEVQQKALLLI